MRRLRNALSYGNVTATVAVFLAISGAAVAVTTAPRNSVVSSSIKDGQVKTPDVGAGAITNRKLAANAVGSGKVADESLAGVDVKDGTLSGNDLGTDSVRSSEILDDSIGAADLGPTTAVNGPVVDIAANETLEATASCPEGTQVLSGGGEVSSPKVVMNEQRPSANGWLVQYTNNDATARSFRIIAVCLAG